MLSSATCCAVAQMLRRERGALDGIVIRTKRCNFMRCFYLKPGARTIIFFRTLT